MTFLIKWSDPIVIDPIPEIHIFSNELESTVIAQLRQCEKVQSTAAVTRNSGS